MRNQAASALRITSSALVCAGYLALASTHYYGPAILLVPLVFIPLSPWGESLDRRYRAYRRVTGACSLVVGLTLLALSPLSLYTLDLLTAITLLVIYVQIYALMHEKRARDYYYLFLMSFFLLLAASVMSPEPLVGVALFIALVSGVCALLALRIHTEMRDTGTDAPPDIYCIDEGQPAMVPEPEDGLGTGLILATMLICLAALAITTGFFLVTPRFEAGFLGRKDAGPLVTGLDSVVNLNESGLIAQDPTPVMRVEFPEEPDGQYRGPLFWRCTTLPSYADGMWIRRPVPTRIDDSLPRTMFRNTTEPSTGQKTIVSCNAKGTGRLIRQQIYMDDVPTEGVPALPLVQTMRCTGNPKGVTLNWDMMNDHTVLMARLGPRRLQYDVLSEVDMFTPQQLRGAPDDYADAFGKRSFEFLTWHPLDEDTQRLVRNLTEAQPTVYDKVMAIQRWLGSEGGFGYTLNVPELDPARPMDDFIRNVKRGHCELFASAMALMVRVIGVPSRVVTGYRGGEWNAADRSYLVRADMAHLWVEIYFLDHGWIAFDPSPPADDSDLIMSRGLLSRGEHLILRAKMTWYRNVVAYDRGLQITALGRLRRLVSPEPREPKGHDSKEETRKPLFRLPQAPAVVFGGVLLAGLAALVAMRSRSRKDAVPPHVLTDDQARAVRLFRGLCRRLRRGGIECRGQTAEEILTQLERRPLAEVGVAMAVLFTYNRVRFGGRRLPRHYYANLRRGVRRFRLESR
ncbi:MAG TPA: DUF3488 and transglutaminase-like domain-containing protein [Candidatus Hydrogenedentes bacterium]|nr:DUF3488 and transglutaminase-like domain-containing protein [Candidatus Hydrogenedentota bacterium]HPG68037.1 DUF3488 and transglutaminase-like domain-containing protein [Candidatus Hydrogenedentota bacterium]